jgi:8-oxo-dGTP pyrophosphatase MutT (NUDIX family)
MKIDPRLNEIDDCLYRVATKAILVQQDKVLLVKQIPEEYWGFPGGGVDYGESLEASLVRELVEELGIKQSDMTTDFRIVHHTIGAVVDNVPRMNLFYNVTIPNTALRKTDQVAEWQWFERKQFMALNMSPSSADRAELAKIIFG